MALKKVLVIISILNLLWFLYVLTSIFSDILRKKLEKDDKKLASGLVPLFQRVANVLVTCLLLLYLLEALGFNVNTLLAGLGVGGIAVALASQKTIENLFGGVVLFFDHPVKVGDFGKFGDISGIIEDIGLRSTRIRTPQRTVVSIPNAELIQRQIENFSSRDKILFHRKIGLRYETSADQIRYIVAELRKLLLSLEYVDNEPARVRFVEMGDFSLNLEIFCYFRTGDWPTYLQMQEDLLLRIMETIAKAGTEFAFPSQTLYLERAGKFGHGQDDIHKIVDSWRSTCSVPLPDYNQSTQEEFRDTIQFPAIDSVLHKK
jgi:MscS family membrane protein